MERTSQELKRTWHILRQLRKGIAPDSVCIHYINTLYLLYLRIVGAMQYLHILIQQRYKILQLCTTVKCVTDIMYICVLQARSLLNAATAPASLNFKDIVEKMVTVLFRI